MKLEDLQPNPGSRRKRTRVGRGIASGHGKTSGRGTKGAGARGRTSRSPAYFEGGQLPLVRRLPFKRGFNNIFKIHYQEINLGDLNELLEANATVTPELLKSMRLIRDSEKPVVLLGWGNLSKPMTIHAHRASKSAVEKVAAAGGTFVKIELLVKGAEATVKLLRKEELAVRRAARDNATTTSE